MSRFVRRLEALWDLQRFVCIGLDPREERIPPKIKMRTDDPAEQMALFACDIVDATGHMVLAYKPNIAFWEGFDGGLDALKRVCRHIRENFPEVVLILDCKRGDIGATNKGYVRMAVERMGADAVTIHGYMGMVANKPFLDQHDVGVIVLAKTSNEGAGEFQDLITIEPDVFASFPSGNFSPERRMREFDAWRRRLIRCALPLFERVAKNVAERWNENGNCSVVVGATYPDDLAQVRSIVGTLPILIPGLGAQGGDAEATILAGMDSRGWGMIVNSSRGIIHASDGDDFVEKALAAANALHERINRIRLRAAA